MRDEARVRCDNELCRAPVEGLYREVIGVERRRTRGTSRGFGGQNQGLVVKRYTGREWCRECGDKLVRGIPLGQGVLFPGLPE